jgi:hypothetical protein
MFFVNATINACTAVQNNSLTSKYRVCIKNENSCHKFQRHVAAVCFSRWGIIVIFFSHFGFTHRVARWDIFYTKKINSGLFFEGLGMKKLDIVYICSFWYFVSILCILSPFCIFCDNLVYISSFWYLTPKKIWQPCSLIIFRNRVCQAEHSAAVEQDDQMSLRKKSPKI